MVRLYSYCFNARGELRGLIFDGMLSIVDLNLSVRANLILLTLAVG